MKRIFSVLLVVALLLSSTVSIAVPKGGTSPNLGLTKEPKPATEYTARANAKMYSLLDFDDKRETTS